MIDDGLSAWGRFVAAVAWWNVYGLPALLAVVAAAGWRRGRLASGSLARAGRRLGLAHLGLAAWSLARVADELWAYRAMGVFPSNPVTGLPGSLLLVAIDLPLGLGLLALRPWARRLALGVSAARLALSALVLGWSLSNGVAFDATEWPRLALGPGLPLLGLVVLLWPGMRDAFRRGEDAGAAGAGRLPAVAALVALVALGSVVLTDAADLALRVAVEPSAEGP